MSDNVLHEWICVNSHWDRYVGVFGCVVLEEELGELICASQVNQLISMMLGHDDCLDYMGDPDVAFELLPMRVDGCVYQISKKDCSTVCQSFLKRRNIEHEWKVE